MITRRGDFSRFLSSPPVFLCCVASLGYSFWHNLWKNLTWSGDLENEISSVATLLFGKKTWLLLRPVNWKSSEEGIFYMRQIFLFVCFLSWLLFWHLLIRLSRLHFPLCSKARWSVRPRQWAERRFSFSFHAFLCKFLNKIALLLQCA